jgi:hypothetical protein
MEALLNELRQEAEATRSLLDRVPEERLGWLEAASKIDDARAIGAACGDNPRRS